ncbi:MAG: type IV pilin protein [Burkholderiales bacterium]|nr:MAG: type IV pilin protein [Burkholderiales bacterium]
MQSIRSGHRTRAGFTLVELVIVVAIIGILTVVAFPSYSEYVRRSNRSAAQSFLQDVAQRQQQYFIDRRSYAASLGDLNLTVPTDVARNYSVNVASVVGPPPGFALTATPIASSVQATDPTLSLDNAGVKLPAGLW